MEGEINLEEKRKLYLENFSLGHLGKDFTSKVALISLIGYVVYNVRKKRPTITYLEVIKSLSRDANLTPEFINTLAIVCEDFCYGCSEFPTFDIENKQIPAKIREILLSWNPF